MALSIDLQILAMLTVFLALVNESLAFLPNAERPLVSIPQGHLLGEVLSSRDGRPFFSFKGIPFGKADRFHYSEPANRWGGIRNASDFGDACLQFDTFKVLIHGSDDCLFLNVYTPQDPNNSTTPGLPVLFFIHGGGFNFGSGADYGPEYFMDEDIVLVTINYRLSMFGFMDTPHGANVGLKDQVLALKWVKDNIHSFGGNPNSVTIFGESAGSGSVALHIMSPMSKGLFHRAISNSGAQLQTIPNPARELKKVGVIMDCPTGNRNNLTECLKNLDGKAMLQKLLLASTLPGFEESDNPTFGPTVENSGSDTFLHDLPINILMSGDFNHVPYMLGANSHEALSSVYLNLAFSKPLRDQFNEHWDEFAPGLFDYKSFECNKSKSLRQFYLGDNLIGTDIQSLTNITNAGTDSIMLYPIKTTAEFHAKYAPTYLYYFSLRGPHTVDLRWLLLPGHSPDGLAPAGHIDELQYLFDLRPLYPLILSGSPFKAFSNWLVKVWATFAIDGSTPTNWTPFQPSQVEWFQIDTTSQMVPEIEILGERMNFWSKNFPIIKTN